MIFHQLNFVADGFEIFNKFIIVKKSLQHCTKLIHKRTELGKMTPQSVSFPLNHSVLVAHVPFQLNVLCSVTESLNCIFNFFFLRLNDINATRHNSIFCLKIQLCRTNKILYTYFCMFNHYFEVASGRGKLRQFPLVTNPT